METLTHSIPSHICIAWIPTLVHERIKPLDKSKGCEPIDGSLFRISDYVISNTNVQSQDILDFWGKITLVPSIKDPLSGIQCYDIKITIYRCSDIKILELIHKLNKQRTKLRILLSPDQEQQQGISAWNKLRRNYRSYKVKQIERNLSDLGAPQNDKLIKIHQLDLSYCYCSRNGMMCYTYNFTPPTENRYNIFGDGNIPDCIYHQIKSMFHRHEFHDKEHDAQFSLFSALLSDYPDIQINPQNENTWNPAICKALTHYINGFERYFDAQRKVALERRSDSLKEKFPQFLNVFDVRYWIVSYFIAYLIPFLTWLLWNPHFSMHHGIFLFVALFFIPLFIFIILRWNKKINKETSSTLLRLEGEYRYAQSLLNSKYKCDDSYRSNHNIQNDFEVTKSYIEALERKGHTEFALLTIGMSIIFFVAELIVAFGLDYKSTETITEESKSIKSATNFVRHEVLKINPITDSLLIHELDPNETKEAK